MRRQGRMTEITILAVSRIGRGVCVAGVTEEENWIRPTRPNWNDSWRCLSYGHCRDENDNWVVHKGHKLRMHLVRPIPKGDHSEDWLIGNRRPELVEVLPEDRYQDLCEAVTEATTDPIEEPTAGRSLIMVHPDRIVRFSFQHDTWGGVKKYRPRCDCVVGGRSRNELPISDAEWRGYGREVMESHDGNCTLRASAVFNKLGTEDCWLTIGRNQVRGTPYLLVVGVHLFPVQRFEMDFNRA